MTRLWRTTWWILGIAFCVGGVVLISIALPIQTWRTGRSPAEPLTFTTGGREVGQTDRIWIDTDAACTATTRADPDDCFAIALLLKSRAAHIVGVSTVFGNAALAVTDNTTRVLLDQFRTEQKYAIKIYSGAAFPIDDPWAAAPTPAREALRAELTKGPLTIVSLGPLTNIAAALDQRPQLQANVKSLIAVMGRRPGHIFHPAEGAGGASLLGHGPVFRDFNFVQDKEAVARVISMQLPLILVPYDASQNLAITELDLAHLSLAGGGVRWIAQRAAGWLEFWKNDAGQPGFYPFDLAAAAYVLHAASFDCATVEARVARDDALWTSWFYRPRALLVSAAAHPRTEQIARAEITYCPRVQFPLKQTLIVELMARQD